VGSVFAKRTAEVWLLAKPGKEFRQGRSIFRILEDKTIESFGDGLRNAAAGAGDHRKAASHSFEWRQGKRFVKRGSAVGVRGGIEPHNVRRRIRKENPFTKME